jgi:hypothetical protein
MRKLSSPIAFALAGLVPFLAAGAAPDATDLQARLAEAERMAGWVPVLAMLCGVLIALVLLLAWRLWNTSRAARATESTLPSSISLPTGESQPAPAPELPRTSVQLSAYAPPEPTIEEHIDLDQQVDFLLVLGQDEEAIDLLLEHLRGTGGTSPGPYLRLMQIYRRRGDQGAYERTRERFNQRFNALAPEWTAGVAGLRELTDYPEVFAEIQRAWPVALDAATTIETLLFRRGSEDERFDLPAYEELLFLYWLSRERQQEDGRGAAQQVDVLLPVDEAQSAVVSVIQPAAASARPARQGAESVDLDLSTVPAAHDLGGETPA